MEPTRSSNASNSWSKCTCPESWSPSTSRQPANSCPDAPCYTASDNTTPTWPRCSPDGTRPPPHTACTMTVLKRTHPPQQGNRSGVSTLTMRFCSRRRTHLTVHPPGNPPCARQQCQTLGLLGRLVHLDQAATHPSSYPSDLGRNPCHQHRAATQQDPDLDSIMPGPYVKITFFRHFCHLSCLL